LSPISNTFNAAGLLTVPKPAVRPATPVCGVGVRQHVVERLLVHVDFAAVTERDPISTSEQLDRPQVGERCRSGKRRPGNGGGEGLLRVAVGMQHRAEWAGHAEGTGGEQRPDNGLDTIKATSEQFPHAATNQIIHIDRLVEGAVLPADGQFQLVQQLELTVERRAAVGSD